MDKGDGKVKYVLSGEGATSIFTIDENTGDIHATKRLDREAQAYYTLQAQAVDRLTNLPVEPRSEFVVKVQDINDNEPKFLDGPYLAGVPEMSPLGTSLSFSVFVFFFFSALINEGIVCGVLKNSSRNNDDVERLSSQGSLRTLDNARPYIHIARLEFQ